MRVNLCARALMCTCARRRACMFTCVHSCVCVLISSCGCVLDFVFVDKSLRGAKLDGIFYLESYLFLTTVMFV